MSSVRVGIVGNNEHIDLKKLFEIAEQNTKYNSHGQAVISRDDHWIKESEWDELYVSLLEDIILE